MRIDRSLGGLDLCFESISADAIKEHPATRRSGQGNSLDWSYVTIDAELQEACNLGYVRNNINTLPLSDTCSKCGEYKADCKYPLSHGHTGGK